MNSSGLNFPWAGACAAEVCTFGRICWCTRAGKSGVAALREIPATAIPNPIDHAGAGKITIKHGPIKKLDMDMDMTMAFKAADPAMLSQVKPGDKIKFDAEKVNGQFTVVKIEAKK